MKGEGGEFSSSAKWNALRLHPEKQHRAQHALLRAMPYEVSNRAQPSVRVRAYCFTSLAMNRVSEASHVNTSTLTPGGSIRSTLKEFGLPRRRVEVAVPACTTSAE